MILSALSLTFLLTRINAELTSQETNALSIGATSMLGLTRPDQFSTGMAYTSWESLTDRSYYDRQIKAAPQDWVDSLPSLDDVSELFVNPQDGVRKYSLYSTMLLPIFADYLTEGFIYPDNYQNSDMPFNYGKTLTNHNIDMFPLYGRTIDQTHALRTMVETDGMKGRLKSQIVENGEEYPPFLYDSNGEIYPEFQVLDQPTVRNIGEEENATSTSTVGCPLMSNLENKDDFLAVGHPGINLLPTLVAMDTLFLREHNRIAGELEKEYPDWDDERVFQTTRNIVIAIYCKIVIEEYIAHLGHTTCPKVDPTPSLWDAPWYKTNWINAEFAVMYRWHTLQPSYMKLGDNNMTILESLFRTDLLLDGNVSLKQLFLDVSSQPAASFEAFNTDPYLVARDQQSVKISRALQLAPFADYMEFYGESRPQTFQDITTNPVVLAKLKELYRTVDDVEFFVGLMIQDKKGPSSIFSPTMNMAVARDAFSQALTNPLFSQHVWNEETFSSHGWSLVNQPQSMQGVVDRNTGTGEMGYVGFYMDPPTQDKCPLVAGDDYPFPASSPQTAPKSSTTSDRNSKTSIMLSSLIALLSMSWRIFSTN